MLTEDAQSSERFNTPFRAKEAVFFLELKMYLYNIISSIIGQSVTAVDGRT
jgi:hypothetical protein